MAPYLPDDVLFLICEVLYQEQEFHTLFCCCLASKRLLIPAISNLYRMYNAAPVTSAGVEDAPQKLGRDSTASWAKLWRMLLLSTRGSTAYPYCKYIRSLDLHDLQNLLEDQRFRTSFSNDFFSGELADLNIESERPQAIQTRSNQPKRLPVAAIVKQIGDALTNNAPLIYELAGDIKTESLIKWIPRLRHLRSLRLWDGMQTKGIGPVLREHCPEFDHLAFFSARSDEADTLLAEFLRDLRPHTLISFMVYSISSVSNEFFRAMNHHSHSLTLIYLEGLSGEAFANMGHIGECPFLCSLSINLRSAPVVDATAESALPGVVAWLRSCTQLTELYFNALFDTGELFPRILAPVLVSGLRIIRLSVMRYGPPQPNSQPIAAFYAALAMQAGSMRSLLLRAEGEAADNDALTAALVTLHGLIDLRLQSVSDYFQDHHLISLAAAMPNLESLWISGWCITDAVWGALAELPWLHSLELSAFSAFTYEGTSAFIKNLNPIQQRGFYLSITHADPNSELAQSVASQTVLQLQIANRLEGRFEFTKARDPNAEEFSSSDSD